MGQYKRRDRSDSTPIKVVGSNTMNFTIATNGDLIADSATIVADASSWKVTVDHAAIVSDLVAGIHAQLSAQMGALESAIVNITVN